MLAFLLPLASKVISDAVAKIPENEELGEKLVEICLVILGKAVKLTKTDMDDQLLEVVKKSWLLEKRSDSLFINIFHTRFIGKETCLFGAIRLFIFDLC